VGKRVLLAAPRSFCAGVDRAIEIVERLLEQHGPPIYVRHQIVHNDHVVRRLERLGAVFVDSEEEVPPGAICVLSAHGVAPAVRESCEKRGLRVVDAVCPLVSKVHAEARRYADTGHVVALVGHADHVEVIGTKGERPPNGSRWTASRWRSSRRRRSRSTTSPPRCRCSSSASAACGGRPRTTSATRRRTGRTP
jgi:(E)-4-hydroxy-3-methyl-but-2-enyl pyrophosphate reductase